MDRGPVTRVLLADDHHLVRSGIARLLDAQPDFRVVAQVADGRAAVARALEPDVDLAVLDVAMPLLTGLQATRELTSRRDDVRVLILSMHDDESYFFEALRAGASGYVLKASPEEQLVEACRATMRGEPFLFPAAARALIRAYLERSPDLAEGPGGPLTPRESEIVKLIAEGHSSRAIAEQLVISEKTVEGHRSRIFEKLGIGDRIALTRWAIRRGLVEP